MKQLSLLADCSEPAKPIKKNSTRWELFIDGASRNNPGLSGAGVYLLKNKKPVYQEGFYLGIKTNNEAEYLALLLGVFSCKRLLAPHDILYIISDSELLVKQINGLYKIKKPALKKLYTVLVDLLHNLNYSVCHVLRHHNTQADSLANKGVDSGTPVPKAFKKILQDNDFQL